MAANSEPKQPFIGEIKAALLTNALPGELDGFLGSEQEEAAALVAAVAARRKPNEISMQLTSTGGEAGHRRMRLAIVNDDMPFLVDSVGNAIAAHGLVVHRLLHPIVKVERDSKGFLTAFGTGQSKSIIYLELDRADARMRNQLRSEVSDVLADVRAAVTDWREMQQRMRDEGAASADEEGAALMNWFAEGAMTLLGYEVEWPGREGTGGLGIFRFPGDPTDEGGVENAIRYFENGGRVPLMAKGDRRSSIHRRVPLDLVAVPLREKGKITSVGVHVGLWTSEALNAPVEEVPVLRSILLKLDKRFGYNPSSHSGKALRHALSSLPHDLVLNLDTDSVEKLVTAAMTLADRPQPMIVLVRSILRGHLFAFVWLPRDELTTARRLAIGKMIEVASAGHQTAWSVDLGDGDLALIRYTYAIDNKRATPDEKALNATLYGMVRGYLPAVEESMAELVGSTHARRLALTYGDTMPEAYRARYPAADAALDLIRLEALTNDSERSIRLYRLASDPTSSLRLKLYTRGGLVALSDVVPVLENFGFSVLKETPTKFEGVDANVHEFLLTMVDGATVDSLFERVEMIEGAIADVLRGDSEDDPFNKLIVLAGLTPRSAVWLRAWFRYLRQTGVAYSIATVVDALGRAPLAARKLIALFCDNHDPAFKGDRKAAAAKAAKAFEEALRDVRAIDDDRILRLLRSVVDATLRTNAFAKQAAEALAFKIEFEARALPPRAAAMARNLGLQSARRRYPSARRPGRPRRASLVRPARRFPH